MLDIRHYELFLYDGWNNGTWKYEEVASHEIPFHCGQASGMVLCSNSLQSSEIQGMPQFTGLDFAMHLLRSWLLICKFVTLAEFPAILHKKWMAPEGDWQPRYSRLCKEAAYPYHRRPRHAVWYSTCAAYQT